MVDSPEISSEERVNLILREFKIFGILGQEFARAKKSSMRKNADCWSQQQLLPIWRNTLSGIHAIQMVTGLILPHHLSPAQNEFTFDHNFCFQKSPLFPVYLLNSERFYPSTVRLQKFEFLTIKTMLFLARRDVIRTNGEYTSSIT